MTSKNDKSSENEHDYEQQELLFESESNENVEDAQDIDTTPLSDEDEEETVSEASSLFGESGLLKKMVASNFLQYASYVICERAIPNLADGFKPVQRRIMHALSDKDDGRFIKVANIVGHTMQYHPHGDASIAAALVNLVNKRYLIEGQGNFGNIHTGDSAAAPRYIECRLTSLAREEIFNKDLTQYIPSYDGRNKEPVTLPSKLPLLLMLGAEGIAVGLATKILPHNFIEILNAQIAVLRKKSFELFPDFVQGGIMDISEYNNGEGSVRVRAKIEAVGDKSLVIREIPVGTTTESIVASIEDAARRGKVPVKRINDFTAEQVEIELCFPAKTDLALATKALYAFTSCETRLNSNMIVIHNRRPICVTVDEVVKENTRHLVSILKAELQLRKQQLLNEFHARTLTRIFIEERIYKRIETCKTQAEVNTAVMSGLAPFRKELNRDVSKEDVDMLLSLRIKRISLFDINKNKKDIEAILAELKLVEKNLKNLTAYAVTTLKTLIKKYKDLYPRRTEIKTFGVVEVKKLTAEELDINYDKQTGYLGHKVNGNLMVKCSSYDKLLLVWRDGHYKVVMPEDKLYVDKNLLYCDVADRDKIMTVVYTSGGLTYMKRFTTGGTILNKDYSCTLDSSKVLHFQEGTPDELYLQYKPAKGQRIHQQMFTLGDLSVKGARARGNQMTSKNIAKISTKQPRWWDSSQKSPRGVLL